MNTLRRSAFTLVEVLIVIAVVGVLSGIVVTAVNPQRQYTVANDSKRAAAQREIQNAVQQYILDHGTDQLEIIEITRLLTPGQAGIVPICKDGVTYNASCINLDVLVEENYLQALPVDVNEPETSDVTGFTVQILPDGQVSVDNEHLQQGVASDSFTNPAAWTSFTPGNNGVGTDPRGYTSSIFDGRYVYFVPFSKSTSPYVGHGEILRYDTTQSFTDPVSWTTFNTETSLGFENVGYSNATQDSNYVYFIPFMQNMGASIPNNNALRLDKRAEFTDISAWTTFNIEALDPAALGFDRGFYDGTYVYFIPASNIAGDDSLTLRYNTNGSFTDINSWESIDLEALDSTFEGFSAATFDGRYVYFAPNIRYGNGYGLAARYDTQGSISNSASWDYYSMNGVTALGSNYSGYTDILFDGRYVYYAPFWHSTSIIHGYAAQYDTLGSFTDSSSWKAFNITTLNPQAKGYHNLAADDRYIYYIPYRYKIQAPADDNYHGKISRFDRTKSFDDPSAWQFFDLETTGISNNLRGYRGTSYDGRYLYMAPLKNGANFFGEILRYDTKLPIE